MQKSILAIAIALVAVFTTTTVFAQSVEVTKKKMKTTEVKKSEKKACCEGMAEGESCDDESMTKKEVRVIKEKSDETGAMVTKVTIKTVKDGVSEEKTLEGAEAEKYVEQMDKVDDGEMHKDHDTKVMKKKIIKEAEKEVKESKASGDENPKK